MASNVDEPFTIQLSASELDAIVLGLRGHVDCLTLLLPNYPPGRQADARQAELESARAALAKAREVRKSRP